jgi:hypothetical protein
MYCIVSTRNNPHFIQALYQQKQISADYLFKADKAPRTFVTWSPCRIRRVKPFILAGDLPVGPQNSKSNQPAEKSAVYSYEEANKNISQGRQNYRTSKTYHRLLAEK